MRGRKFSLVGGPGQKKNKCPPLRGKTLICCGFKMNYLLCLSSVSFLFFKANAYYILFHLIIFLFCFVLYFLFCFLYFSFAF